MVGVARNRLHFLKRDLWIALVLGAFTVTAPASDDNVRSSSDVSIHGGAAASSGAGGQHYLTSDTHTRIESRKTKSNGGPLTWEELKYHEVYGDFSRLDYDWCYLDRSLSEDVRCSQEIYDTFLAKHRDSNPDVLYTSEGGKVVSLTCPNGKKLTSAQCTYPRIGTCGGDCASNPDYPPPVFMTRENFVACTFQNINTVPYTTNDNYRRTYTIISATCE